MEAAGLKARLVALLHAGSDRQQAFVAGLSAAERDATGTPARWSAKDLVAHLTRWKARRLLQLDAVTRGEEPPQFDMDATNARTWDAEQRRSWEEVMAEEARVVQALVAHVERMSAANLLEPNHYPLPFQPAALLCAHPGYTHVFLHLAEHYIERGALERAIALQEAAASTLDACTDVPSLAATGHYNLACCYARCGKPQRAMPALRLAFARYPAFVERAREDPDLAALRALPDYQALVAGM